MDVTQTFLILAAGLMVGACESEQVGSPLSPNSSASPADAELQLATSVAGAASEEMQARGGQPSGLVRRMVAAVEERGDDEARALLARAAELRSAAREEQDRQKARQAQNLVLLAVVKTFPNAPARVGGIVESTLRRIRAHVADRRIPDRIREVLRRVVRFHNAANDALAKLDEGGTDISPDRLRVRALRFNLRAAMILERFVDHVKKQDAGAGGGDPARPTAR